MPFGNSFTLRGAASPEASSSWLSSDGESGSDPGLGSRLFGSYALALIVGWVRFPPKERFLLAPLGGCGPAAAAALAADTRPVDAVPPNMSSSERCAPPCVTHRALA